MEYAPILYAIAALASGLAAILAWVAKLKWAQEYKDATEQLIRSKDAEVMALRTHVQVLEATGSAKVLERARGSIAALEEALADTEVKLEAAERRAATISTAKETALATPNGESGLDVERKAELEAKLIEAQSQVKLLADQAGSLRLRLLERRRALLEQVMELEGELERTADRLARLEQAPELLKRYAEEMEELRRELLEAQAELDERRTYWLRDRQDAETKLQSYRDRAAELLDQVRQIRQAGPAAACPVCERPLGADFERVVGELEDQWRDVVQDGKWWKGRREQIESQPLEIGVMESRIATLEASLEEVARKHTRAEGAVHELRTLAAERAKRVERAEAVRREISSLEEYEESERASARISDKTP